MWAGAMWNAEFLLYGVLGIVVFGLSFPQAVAVIVVSNVFYLLTGLASRHAGAAGFVSGSDFSVILGLAVGGVLYWLLAGRAVRLRRRAR